MSGNNHGEPSDPRPFLCIPYWPKPLQAGGKWDTGHQRPLPNGVVSYMCEGIKVGPYVPGEALEVSVDIRNSGGGNSAAIATVVVYWDDPTVGFAEPKFLAATTVPVQPNPISPAFATTKTLTPVVPATAPKHACLLVSVSHPQDRAGTACDPVNDRHWAQRNLFAVQAAVGAPVIVPFVAANPFAEAKTLELVLGLANEGRARLVAAEFQTEPGGVPARLRLLNEDGTAASGQARQIRVPLQLGPLERRRFQVMIELDGDLPAERSAIVEAFLMETVQAQRRIQRPVGSLGVVLLPP